MPPDPVPRAPGERAGQEGGLRLPAGLRALLGEVQNALQADVAPLERASQVGRQQHSCLS